MDEILNAIIKLAAAVLVGLLWTLTQKAVALIKSKIDAADAAKLDKLIAELTMAAEQMFKADDPDGSERLKYVQGMLIEAGYDLTDAIRAKIESRVYRINEDGGAAK